MTPNYWHQKANVWVTSAVLVGGLLSSCLVVMIYRMQNDKSVLGFSRESSAVEQGY